MKSDKVAIITGSSRGIGAATAKLFALNGYAVCINYKSDAKAAHDVQTFITSQGASCITVQADVACEEEVLHLFDTTEQQLGKVTVLVNNAGILKQQSRLEDMSADRINTTLLTNITGSLLCAREAVRRMSTRRGGKGGAIVNVSSGAARSGSPNEYIDYAATKGAIDTMTRGLSLEVAADGIRVNGVRPGLIYTDMHASGGEPGRIQRLQSAVPMQRGGQPEEVAEAIYWLASDKASFVTGSIIDVTGGW